MTAEVEEQDISRRREADMPVEFSLQAMSRANIQ